MPRKKIRIIHDKDPYDVPGRPRKTKNSELIEAALMLEEGDWFELPLPHNKSMESERERIRGVLNRHVKPEMHPSLRLRLRFTARRSVQVICEKRVGGVE